ncbi:uncharacterized protein LOC111087120 isoform X1 [Limulus polyphemus]|uniref:Uncharacterized protein LOC111087120 isoform X1 n=1 Tax=Limulus polyphemus TaxID=6850 RepID=A0ABM1SXG1_LIMPO|nr:uncharacterized protein LOC111087120 isoform X1 [Limulus polyphemus]
MLSYRWGRMQCRKGGINISAAIFTIAESTWGLIWSTWALLMLETPNLFLESKVNTMTRSFQKLPQSVDLGLVLFEMILNTIWMVCGFILICGYLRKNLGFVVPWIMTTLIVIIYDVTTTVYYTYRLVKSLKTTPPETPGDKNALIFLLVGFSRCGIIFWCINATFLVLVFRRTLTTNDDKVSEDDVSDSDLDGYEQYPSPRQTSNVSRQKNNVHCPVRRSVSLFEVSSHDARGSNLRELRHGDRGFRNAGFEPDTYSLIRLPRVFQTR